MKDATVVLVHGAFADGSSWGNVIPLLEKHGFKVIAVQNPLTSFADDVATTRRVIDAESGSVILVGHSYGGAVITTAALDRKNVSALVYIAAFGPDEGENLQTLLKEYPSKISSALVPDAAGFLYIDRNRFAEVFAADVTETVLSIMSATQKPINSQTFGQKYDTPAWKTIPSWYLVATEDRMIPPPAQRAMAERAGAVVTETPASHAVYVSKPDAVSDLIEQAARQFVSS